MARITLLMALCLILTACSRSPAEPVAPPDPTLDPRTQIARSVAATVLAVSYPTVTPLPTWTPWPTSAPELPTPTVRPTRTSPQATATPTAKSTPWVVAKTEVNLRSGPGAQYPIIGTTTPNARYEIQAKSPDSAWVQVCCVDKRAAWVSLSVVTFAGDLGSVAIAKSMPTPLPVPKAAPTLVPTAVSEQWVNERLWACGPDYSRPARWKNTSLDTYEVEHGIVLIYCYDTYGNPMKRFDMARAQGAYVADRLGWQIIEYGEFVADQGTDFRYTYNGFKVDIGYGIVAEMALSVVEYSPHTVVVVIAAAWPSINGVFADEVSQVVRSVELGKQ